jgi:hypothetical protein
MQEAKLRKLWMMAAIAAVGLGAAFPAGQAFEPDHVTVQHILVAFQGTIPGSSITRSRDEAETLAKELYARAQKGEDFDALVKEFTNDEYPGIYGMANTGIEADAGSKEYSRGRLVKAFGDVGFRLRIGEIGLAAYDPAASKYGWHIIKRIK